jgi:hypothetical protein
MEQDEFDEDFEDFEYKSFSLYEIFRMNQKKLDFIINKLDDKNKYENYLEKINAVIILLFNFNKLDYQDMHYVESDYYKKAISKNPDSDDLLKIYIENFHVIELKNKFIKSILNKKYKKYSLFEHKSNNKRNMYKFNIKFDKNEFGDLLISFFKKQHFYHEYYINIESSKYELYYNLRRLIFFGIDNLSKNKIQIDDDFIPFSDVTHFSLFFPQIKLPQNKNQEWHNVYCYYLGYFKINDEMLNSIKNFCKNNYVQEIDAGNGLLTHFLYCNDLKMLEPTDPNPEDTKWGKKYNLNVKKENSIQVINNMEKDDILLISWIYPDNKNQMLYLDNFKNDKLIIIGAVSHTGSDDFYYQIEKKFNIKTIKYDPFYIGQKLLLCERK